MVPLKKIQTFTMFVILAVLGLIVGCNAQGNRIVNGEDADQGEVPYIVSVRRNRNHICGGSILDDKHVLTAAHCMFGKTNNPLQFSIQYAILKVTNDSDNAVQVQSILMHPEYVNSGTFNNDVAILVLNDKIIFTCNALPVVLPRQWSPTPEDKDAVLAGWGLNKSGGSLMKYLQIVDLIIYSTKNCAKAHKTTDPKYHVCAGIPEGGKGQCSGDSGGPLTVNGTQYGIVSWSVKPCAAKGSPGVFTKVANYVDWITQKMKVK